MATCDMLYVREMMSHLKMDTNTPTTLFVDNKGVVDIARDPLSTTALKHVKRRHFFVREIQHAGDIYVLPISSNLNLADMLTKELQTVSHLE